MWDEHLFKRLQLCYISTKLNSTSGWNRYGWELCGDSVPVTYAPVGGGGGSSNGGGGEEGRKSGDGEPPICTKLQFLYFYFKFTIYVLVPLLGEVDFGRRKKHNVLFIFPVLMRT